MQGEELMKALKKVNYSPDVDILTIQLSNKKIDDSYETENSIMSVDKKGEPVLLEIFDGKKYLNELGKIALKNKIPNQSFAAIPHRIK